MWLKHAWIVILGAFILNVRFPAGGVAQATPTPPASQSESGSRPDPLSPAEFEHLSIEQGLAESMVWCIWQDRQGFMWFGTEDGLDKYDGRAFTVYKHLPGDQTSLSQNNIRAIYEDHLGTLWVGTASGGLNRFDPGSGRFVHYQHNDADPLSLSSDAITTIFEDDQHTLWIGTASGGLNAFDRATQQFTYIPIDAPGAGNPNNTVQAIFQDRAGALWLGTPKGLERFDRDSQHMVLYRHSPDASSLVNNHVWAIADDLAGNLWVGTDGGLEQFDRATGRFSHFTSNPAEPGTLSHNQVRTIYRDVSGALWIGTFGGGLNRLDPLTHQFTRFQNNLADPASLSNNRVVSLYQERGGLLWIGTYGGGLNKYNPDYQPFAHYKSIPGEANSLSENLVSSVFADPTGTIWVGTDGGGLNQIDRVTEQIHHYKNNPVSTRSLSHNTVQAILVDRQRQVWVGTAFGLNRFEPGPDVFTRFSNTPDDTGRSGYDNITALAEDHADTLWVGTNGAGLDSFDRATSTFTYSFVNDPANPASLGSNTILALAVDSRGVLWVGTDQGLDQFDPATRTFSHYRNAVNDAHSLSDNYVMALHEDQGGRLWVGTTGGLNCFDPATRTFTIYREKDGLPNDYIYGILDDAQGYLWLSSNKGLARFNPATQAIQSFDAKDGLQSDEFNAGVYAESADGEMFFGGINGLTAFRPEQIRDNPYVPPVVLTAVTQRGQAVPVSTASGAQRLRLQWPDNYFEFEFAALSYVRPEKNQYSYRLEGFDKDWNYIGARHIGQYTNLPGGTYTLKLKGANNAGVWSSAVTALTVTVTPPVWDTGWFQAGLTAVLLAAVFGGYWWRVRTVEARSQELERQVRERTREIEQRNQQVEALYRAGEKIYRSLTLDQVLQALADVAVDTLAVDKSVVFMRDADCGRFKLRVARGLTQRAMWRLSFGPGEGVVGRVAAEGQPQAVDEVAALPRGELAPLAQALLAEGICTAVFLPIRVGPEVFGVFGVCATTPRAFGQETRRLFLDLTQRAALSVENTQLFEQTKELAVLEERTRLARDLHDSAKQKAFAALAQLGAARGTLPHTPAATAEHLTEAENLVYDVIQELTFLIQELYPRALKENGLAMALREYIFEWENCSGLQAQLSIEAARRLPLEIEQALFRICQEALANVARHSRAARVDVTVDFQPERVELIIADNGQGFDPSRKYAGLGLRTMRERAEAMGGTLAIQSAPGQGARVAAQVRLPPAELGAEPGTRGEHA